MKNSNRMLSINIIANYEKNFKVKDGKTSAFTD